MGTAKSLWQQYNAKNATSFLSISCLALLSAGVTNFFFSPAPRLNALLEHGMSAVPVVRHSEDTPRLRFMLEAEIT